MENIIQKHCNYQKLISYQNSVVIFDATVKFCSLFLNQRDRTVDQMIQAARSGKQNIIEGCSAAAVSSETEIKLYGVARASLEELLEDYRDYLRTHHMALWDRTDPRIQKFRDTITQEGVNSPILEIYLSPNTPELYCNTVITLIHLTNYLLDRHLKKLERSFSENGGIRERMFAARNRVRNDKKEKALTILREVYCELITKGESEIAQKLATAAQMLK